MNRRFAAESALVFISILASVSGIPAATPILERAVSSAKADAEGIMIGKDAGELRHDNDLRMQFVWCPPGKTAVEGDRGEIELSAGFWLGKYEVTQSEWTRMMASKPWVVWEWCREWYVAPQPIGQDTDSAVAGSHRVIRGGSWWNGALECRSARRDRQTPDHSDFSLGFRVALSPIPSAK